MLATAGRVEDVERPSRRIPTCAGMTKESLWPEPTKPRFARAPASA